MQALIVPSSSSGETIQLLSSYVVNRTIAIDAGSLGLYGTIEQQSLVRHIFLTHCHLDHIASLPPFLDAVYDGSGNCVTIHGNAHVLEILRSRCVQQSHLSGFLKNLNLPAALSEAQRGESGRGDQR
jgi:glyoxylase-like metal-dependent hydrolase (beta-lactamase superfamily II)